MPTTTVLRSPRALLAKTVLLALAVLVLSGCLTPAQKEVLTQVNATRAAHGLPALAELPAATSKAQAWAEHLANVGTLSHSTLTDGLGGVAWRRIGENVGWHTDGVAAVHSAYMASPPHRQNILGDWTHLGVGYATANGRTYTVQVFVKL